MPDRPRASIIVLAYNHLPATRLCVESVRAYSADIEHELILVDNGSTDGTERYFRSIPGARVVSLKPNRGYAAGNNAGMRTAQGDHIVILSNDTIVTAGWLNRLVAYAEWDEKLGLVGPMTNNATGAQRLPGDHYRTPDGLQLWARYISRKNAGALLPVRRLIGFCLLVKRAVVEQIGYLDERFGYGNYEDDDYCMRASRAGFNLAIATDVYIHHEGGVTMGDLSKDGLADLMERNKAQFDAKWKGIA